jgi:SEC-C motif-containing protein
MPGNKKCPCGSGDQYAHCCGRYISQPGTAVTAEALMRSRYCAYARKDKQYLLQTWHPSTRPSLMDLDDEVPMQWIGLKILCTEAGGRDDDKGLVEFVALFKVNGRAGRLHEISRFIKEDGRWFYVDGDTAPRAH